MESATSIASLFSCKQHWPRFSIGRFKEYGLHQLLVGYETHALHTRYRIRHEFTATLPNIISTSTINTGHPFWQHSLHIYILEQFYEIRMERWWNFLGRFMDISCYVLWKVHENLTFHCYEMSCTTEIAMKMPWIQHHEKHREVLWNSSYTNCCIFMGFSYSIQPWKWYESTMKRNRCLFHGTLINRSNPKHMQYY